MAKCFVGDLAFDVTDGTVHVGARPPARVAFAPGWAALRARRCGRGSRSPTRRGAGAPLQRVRRSAVGACAARGAEATARLGADARSRGGACQATVCKGTSKGKDKETSKGYGFVVFSDEVSAELACTVGKQSGQRIWRVRKQNTPGSAVLRAAGTEATPRAAPRLHAHRPLCARAPRYARGSTCAWALH